MTAQSHAMNILFPAIRAYGMGYRHFLAILSR